MKRLSKKLSPLIITLIVCTSLQPTNALAASTLDGTIVSVESSVGITPYSNVIEWRYKLENGNLYKRQYNCSTHEWIGEWELC